MLKIVGQKLGMNVLIDLPLHTSLKKSINK